MKKDRNCSTPYPVYQNYQGMGPIPYGMPMIGPNMMQSPMMNPMPQMTQPTYNMNSYENQINNLENKINSLEKRVNNLENLMNSSNSISNNYNSSNYQML